MKKELPSISEFITLLEKELTNIEHGSLKPETCYKDIESWNSMNALVLITTIDYEYGVILGGEQLLQCNTINDLYNVTYQLIKSNEFNQN